MKNYADRGGSYPSRPKLDRRQQTLTRPQSSSRNARGGRREKGAKQGGAGGQFSGAFINAVADWSKMKTYQLVYSVNFFQVSSALGGSIF